MVRLHGNFGPFGISTNNLGSGASLRFMYEGTVEAIQLAAKLADLSVRKAEEAAGRRRLDELETLIEFVESLHVAHHAKVPSPSAIAAAGADAIAAALNADTVPGALIQEDPAVPAIIFRAPLPDVTPSRAPTGTTAGELRFQPISDEGRNALYLALIGALTLRVAATALSSAGGVQEAQVFAARGDKRQMELLTIATLREEDIENAITNQNDYPGLVVHKYARDFRGHIDADSLVHAVDVDRQEGLAAALKPAWDRIARAKGSVGAITWG